MSQHHHVNAKTCQYCYLDLDLDNGRDRLAIAAGFVDATDTRYGFSNKILLKLGGSEVSRISGLISTDHEWSTKHIKYDGGVLTKPPTGSGNRIIVKLFWDISPLACENFATLCANGSSSLSPSSTTTTTTAKSKPPPIGESGKPLTYRGSTIHRVIPGFILQGERERLQRLLQSYVSTFNVACVVSKILGLCHPKIDICLYDVGGDFVFGNGSGGESVFGKKSFKDERGGLHLKHDRRGILSMGNSGKNSNTSQFFFAFDKASQCDGKHVIFGEIVSGFDVLEACEKLGTSSGTPTAPISITDCGIYTPLQTPGSGYWYDAPDADSYSGVSSLFIVRPRVAILAPSEAALQKFKSAMGDKVSIVGEVSADTTTEVPLQSKQLMGYLDKYQADIVIVAPACKTVIESMDLPKGWCSSQQNKISLNEVVLIAKPIDAMHKIASESWLNSRPNWQLEYNL